MLFYKQIIILVITTISETRKQWSSTQFYKAHNPAGFSVLPGENLVYLGSQFFVKALSSW